MHVVFAHHKPLPVATYGGTERILFWLMRALVRKGHKVTLIGHPHSQIQKFGIQLVPGTKDDWPTKIPPDSDIVNLFFPWHQELSKPYVCRIGGNGKPSETFPLNTIFISKSHAENHGAKCFVYNGLDLEDYPESLLNNKKSQSEWNRFAFLAKTSWKVKNLSDCIRAIKASNKELHVGGGRAWTLARKVHSYGMVDQKQKFEIFSKTDALLWPIRWPEPFGIAMIEGMAAGLAVLASAHGSSCEIVTPDVGVVCHSYSEFENAIREAPRTFDPKKIRARVMQQFNSDIMADNYLECYEKVLNGHTLNNQHPVAKFSIGADQSLLPF